MPDLIGLLRYINALQLPPSGLVEEAKLDFFRVLGKKREVNAFTIPNGPERVGFTGPYDRLRLDGSPPWLGVPAFKACKSWIRCGLARQCCLILDLRK
jgi:hypothetical protein